MNYDVDKKIKLVEDIFKIANPKIFTRVYPFTTENITGYLPLFDLNKKSLLTVGSSCDQALNAILMGANDVTIFDICQFAYEYYYLKRAAVETLDIEEFMQFFCYKNNPRPFFNNRNAFDLKTYLKMSEVLKVINEDVYHFWNEVFLKYQGVVVRSELFSTNEYRMKLIKLVDNYLSSPECYNELRNKLPKAEVKVVNGDIFSDKVAGKYNNIFLSNLSSYHKLSEMNDLFHKMLNNLKDNGKILIAYLYATDLYSDYMEREPEIYNLPKVFETFPKDIEFTSFVSARGFLLLEQGIRDSVITYKKVKKMH